MAEDTPPPSPPPPPPNLPANAKPVWIVTPALGLHQVATGAVAAAIADGRGRRATEQDFAIAGVVQTLDEEN